MSKTIKLLSDGTIAKVGMIVHSYTTNQIVRITAIRTGARRYFVTIDDTDLLASFKDSNPKGDFFALEDIRKATPEERKQYYNSL